jgi:excisionase family DNA binding protein
VTSTTPAGFGPQFRDQRVRARRTAADVARAAGISRSHLANIESGHDRPSAEVAERLTEVLGLSPADFAMPAGRDQHDQDVTDTDQPPLLYTYEQAARRLSVTVGFLQRGVAAGQIQHTRLGRLVRFSDADLEALVTSNRVAPLPQPPSPRQVRDQLRRRAG